MNERIQELAKQAGYNGHYATEEFDVDEFAELIVRECISTIENAENGYRDYRNQIEDAMRDHCLWLIKDKFGITE